MSKKEIGCHSESSCDIEMSFQVSADDARLATVLERVHEFEGDPEMDVRFVGSIVVFELREILYIGRSKRMLPLEGEGDVDLEGLQGIPICIETVFPLFSPKTFTAAEDSLPSSEMYLKRPSLVHLCQTNMLESENKSASESLESKLILREAKVYELLKKFPHENIVTYYGCKVRSGRIVGFVLERLFETLSERLNTMGNKFDLPSCLTGLQKGLEHIHSLGLCHNDINDQNVMFRANGCPVIIDFNSCQPIGEKLSLTFGTDGWYDTGREYSNVENDDDAVNRIRSLVQTKMKETQV